MNIEIKTSGGYTTMPIETRMLSRRIVYVQDEINSELASNFLKEVMYLNDEDTKKPIYVIFNSVGGEIRSGMLMYDVIQGSLAPMVMCCTGVAYSMAAVLLASGSHGRYILPQSKTMIHEPLTSVPFGGSTSSIRSVADSMLEERNRMNAILAKHTGKSEKEIFEAASYDHYFTAKETVDFGMCDKVMVLGDLMHLFAEGRTH